MRETRGIKIDFDRLVNGKREEHSSPKSAIKKPRTSSLQVLQVVRCEDEEFDNIACEVCGLVSEDIFLCDVCNQGYHQQCVTTDIPAGEQEWYCGSCSWKVDLEILSDSAPGMVLQCRKFREMDRQSRQALIASMTRKFCGHTDMSMFEQQDQQDLREALLFRMHPVPSGHRIQQQLSFIAAEVSKKLRIKNAAPGEQTVSLRPFFPDQAVEWKLFLSIRGFLPTASRNAFSTCEKHVLEVLFSSERGFADSILQKTVEPTFDEQVFLEKNPQPATLRNTSFVALSQTTPFRFLFGAQVMSVKFFYQAYDFRGFASNRPKVVKKTTTKHFAEIPLGSTVLANGGDSVPPTSNVDPQFHNTPVHVSLQAAASASSSPLPRHRTAFKIL
jgi:hypothetical protein